ncbi:hypothetical protein sos41_00470 [Alphaproteobacteria bacterium SO-S41]|nr:hypothetical protein sos41_00470 [Alphaproteobacteria bacterium SO-S41]
MASYSERQAARKANIIKNAQKFHEYGPPVLGILPVQFGRAGEIFADSVSAGADKIDQWLGDLVEAYPNLFAVSVATASHTVIEGILEPTADLGRIGKSTRDMMETGTVSPGEVLSDAVRIITLLTHNPAFGKKVQQAVGEWLTNKGTKAARLIADGEGGICAWVSGLAAGVKTGQLGNIWHKRLFMQLDDLAAALKVTTLKSGMLMDELMTALGRLGMKFGAKGRGAPGFITPPELGMKIPKDGSVAIVGVIDTGVNAAKREAHAVIMFWEDGVLKVLDRGGGRAPMVTFDSWAEFVKAWGSGPSKLRWLIDEYVLVPNLFMKNIVADGIRVLAVALGGILKLDTETALETAAVQKAVAEGNAPVPMKVPPTSASAPIVVEPQPDVALPPNFKVYTVQRGDSLSAIAKRFYGKFSKWPILYVANKAVIGKNPDRIKPGQLFWIPEIKHR